MLPQRAEKRSDAAVRRPDSGPSAFAAGWLQPSVSGRAGAPATTGQAEVRTTET